MSGETLVIANPAAGRWRAARQLSEPLDTLRQNGWNLRVLETNAPGHAIELASQAWESGSRRFIAVGGDGTSCEVVTGMMRAARGSDTLDEAWLGILPAGTGNSFLRDMGQTTLAQSLDGLLSGVETMMDVGELKMEEQTIYSLNLVGLGFIADVCDVANRHYKMFFKHSAYNAAVFHQLARLRPLKIGIGINGGPVTEREVTFISLSNSRFTGGAMEMAPLALPNDGEVDLIEVAPYGRIKLIATFPKIFSGSHLSAPGISSSRAREVVFELDSKLPVMVDGEVFIDKPESYTVLHKALRVAVPAPVGRP